jgi:hypothetical protein
MKIVKLNDIYLQLSIYFSHMMKVRYNPSHIGMRGNFGLSFYELT